VGKEVDGIEDSVIFRSLQALAVPLIGNACHIFMHGLNSVQIYGAEKLQQALQERPKGKPLLTVCDIIVTTHTLFHDNMAYYYELAKWNDCIIFF
jgi:hypothetical protein